ncbi:MAG TPA: protein kinase, partial [Candidatus Eisenbacteria bacterium]
MFGSKGRPMSESSQRLTTALAGRYRIERELGRGGMATVFLAEDLRHHRRVAIKVLDPELAAAIGSERFQREIETVAGLAHPHILPLHDSGQAAGLLYYVMPYVEGESLRRRLERETQLSVEEALRITREVAGALAHAHGRGIVHRDVKPENILLQDGHALLADFGIARAAAAGGEKLTATGIAVGTPAYMSPEQSVGGGHLDGRSDLYSLGCVLYEMLAGQAPFTGPRAESVVFQHLNAPPPKVTAIRPAVPAGIERAIVKAMAKTPADRHATAGDFEAALERGLAEPAARPRARGARWSALAVVALGALSAVAAWQSWWPFGGGAPPPPATKDWILVAEFDGPPGDSALAPAARSLLSAALDQSRIVATVPQDQIRQALRLAGKPPTARVDATLARELAYRSAVRAVLEGTIGRLGSGYSIVLRVVDADTSR